MKFHTIVLFFCSLFVCIPQAYTATGERKEMLVIVVGDELTGNGYLNKEQRFPAQLQKKMRDIGFSVKVEDIQLIDITSSEFVDSFNTVTAKAPDLVILQIGETDVKRGLPPRNLAGNLEHMIRVLKNNNVYVIVMGTTKQNLHGDDYNYQLESVFKRISKNTQTYPSPLHGISGKPELTTGDGYRPNSSGVKIMVEGIYRYVDAGLRWKIKVSNIIRSQKFKETQR